MDRGRRGLSLGHWVRSPRSMRQLQSTGPTEHRSAPRVKAPPLLKAVQLHHR